MDLGEASHVPSASPDMDAVMSQIIQHDNSVDGQYAHHGEVPASADTLDIFPPSASAQLKIQCLPVLDNLVSLALDRQCE